MISFPLLVNDEYVIRGTTAVFACIIPPFVREHVEITSWTLGTTPIVNDERHGMTLDGRLHIRGARPEDTYNSYRCTVQNRLTREEKISGMARLFIVESEFYFFIETNMRVCCSLPYFDVHRV